MKVDPSINYFTNNEKEKFNSLEVEKDNVNQDEKKSIEIISCKKKSLMNFFVIHKIKSIFFIFLDLLKNNFLHAIPPTVYQKNKIKKEIQELSNTLDLLRKNPREIADFQSKKILLEEKKEEKKRRETELEKASARKEHITQEILLNRSRLSQVSQIIENRKNTRSALEEKIKDQTQKNQISKAYQEICQLFFELLVAEISKKKQELLVVEGSLIEKKQKLMEEREKLKRIDLEIKRLEEKKEEDSRPLPEKEEITEPLREESPDTVLKAVDEKEDRVEVEIPSENVSVSHSSNFIDSPVSNIPSYEELSRLIAAFVSDFFQEKKLDFEEKKEMIFCCDQLGGIEEKRIFLLGDKTYEEPYSLIDPSLFWKTLKEKGVQKIGLKINGSTMCRGLYFPKTSAQQHPLLDVFKKLNLYHANDAHASFILRPSSDSLGDALFPHECKDLIENSDSLEWEKADPLEDLPKPKKVLVLTGGMYAYRFSKWQVTEAFEYMLRGFTVVWIDDKNEEIDYSESFWPVYKRRKSLIEKLKETYATDDIIVKGTCFSGPPAANLAKEHPGVHLILDQTYLNADAIIHKVINGNILTWTVSHIINIQNALHKAQYSFEMPQFPTSLAGRVVLITNTNDDQITQAQQSDLVQTIRQASNSELFHNIDLNHPLIKHAYSPFLADSTTKQMEKMLELFIEDRISVLSHLKPVDEQL